MGKVEISGKDLLRAKLLSRSIYFTKYFYRIRYGRDFVVNWHHEKICDALDRVLSGDCRRLCISIAPRFSKTELAVKNFMALGMAVNSKSKFIHLSYSGNLAEDNSENVRDFIGLDEYVDLFPHVELSKSSAGKQKWMTTSGGMVYATATGGQVTGMGAGEMDIEVKNGLNELEISSESRFSGCFPYDEKVLTSIGEISIGDIVTNKMQVSVLTKNLASGDLEYKPIIRYWNNPPNKLVEVVFSDGRKIRCTPDHKIMTSVGWVEAKDLNRHHSIPISFTNIFQLMHGDSEFFTSFRSIKASIISKFNKFIGNTRFMIPNSIRQIFGYRNPSFSKFNLANNSFTNSVSFFQNRSFFGAFKNFNNLIAIKNCTRSIFKKWESSMTDSILHIFGLRAVSEITQPVVCFNTVEMPTFFSFDLRSNKSSQNKLMSKMNLNFRVFRQTISMISVRGFLWFKNFFSKFVAFTRSVCNNSSMAFNPTYIAYRIAFFVTKNRKPIFVRDVGHIDNTFCLSIKDNTNFFIHQNLLVSNCIIIDDALKPDDALSDLKRERVNERFENTIRSRTNSRNTPIIVIGQRLHSRDLIGYLKETEPDEWEFLDIPSIVVDEFGEESALWSFKMTLNELRNIREIDENVFETQYQQNPQDLLGKLLPLSSLKFWNMDNIPISSIVFKFSCADPSNLGGDYYSVPFIHVAIVEGKLLCFVKDVVHSKDGIEVVNDKIIDKCREHFIEDVFMEANGIGAAAVMLLKKDLRNLANVKPFTVTIPKEARILSNFEFIKKHFIFDEKYKTKPEYSRFISHLISYDREGSNKHKKDAIDCLASAANVIKIKYRSVLYGNS